MRIAIIEDDEITRLELSKLLNTQGYETVLLTNFENLTEELKQYCVELVLLDINLPYENGYEVCRKIKQAMPVPIIFVTSRDTNADELKSIQVGGIDFITKPYDTLILLEKIKRALQLSNPNNFRELVKKDCTLPPFLIKNFAPIPIPRAAAAAAGVPYLFKQPSHSPNFSPPVSDFPHAQHFLFSRIFYILYGNNNHFPILQQTSRLNSFLYIASEVKPIILSLLRIS